MNRQFNHGADRPGNILIVAWSSCGSGGQRALFPKPLYVGGVTTQFWRSQGFSLDIHFPSNV